MRVYFVFLTVVFCLLFLITASQAKRSRENSDESSEPKSKERSQENRSPETASNVTSYRFETNRTISAQISISNSESSEEEERQEKCSEIPGSTPNTFKYSSKEAAASIEEAIINLPDLTNPDALLVETNGKQTCEDDELCIACAEQLTDQLTAGGILSDVEGRKIKRKTNPSGKKSDKKCNKYTFGKKKLPKVKGDITQIDKCLKEKTRPNWWHLFWRAGIENATLPRIIKADTKRRSKRQTAIGEVWTISCVERGEPENYGVQTSVILCNTCWQWRVLPADYFPQYINEMACDSDTRCLSGYGKCEQRNKNVDVLRNVAPSGSPPNWQSTTVTVSSCCDCKITYGSTLHAFVSS